MFGFPYRLWTSLHARCQLDAVSAWVDDSLHGNRKGRQTAHLWKALVFGLEDAHETSRPLHGITADIVKCYNCLPRWPILAMAVQCGLPPQLTTAWAGALAQMVRHFRVRDSFSSGCLSSTGMAEGCALSCLGMLLLDEVFHKFVALQGGGSVLRAHTFVDNWEIWTHDPSWAMRQLDVLLQFTAMTDLTLDVKKTYAWSTHAPTRKALRKAGLTVLQSARDLGAHVCYTKKYSNSTLLGRIAALDDFWPRLRLSPCPWPVKIRCVRTVAWPRGLHAVSASPVGKHVWVRLRQKLAGALNFHKPGVNSAILVGLTETDLDPEFCALVLTLKDARAFSSGPWWTDQLARCAHGFVDLPPTSPARILLDRLHRCGLSVSPSGSLCDQFGQFHPVSCNFSEVLLRLQWAWQSQIAEAVSHRRDFQGLAAVDLPLSRKLLRNLPGDKQALFRLGLCGGSFTEDYKSHWSGESDVCRWCGEPDSLTHRYWTCPQTQPFRDLCAPTATRCWRLLPPACSLRGWAPRAPTWPLWISTLLDFPSEVPPLHVPLQAGCWHDIFTDGSCLWQACASYRVASWGVLLARPFSSNWTFAPATPLGAGPLPGLCQTSFRAEVYALAFALHWAAVSGAFVRIWIDCLGVVTKFTLLTQGKASLSVSSPNADLWYWILDSVNSLGLDKIVVQKVAAHQQLQFSDPVDVQWATWYNNAVDHLAKQANLTRPERFWTVWFQHMVATHEAMQLAMELRDLHVAVAEFSVKTAALHTQVTENTATVAPRQARTFEPMFDNSCWTGVVPPQLATQYGRGHARRVVAWWQARITEDAAGPPQWVSFIQLYVDYQLTFGCPGPLKRNGAWLDVASRPYLDVRQFQFRDRVRWFRRFIQNLLVETGVKVAFAQCRPVSDSIQTYVPSASVRWDPWCLQQVEGWLLRTLPKPCTRNADAVKHLDVPNAASGMAVEIPKEGHFEDGLF